MQIARDVTEGSFLLRMIGREQVWLENYKSLLTYTDRQIIVSAKNLKIEITGCNMRIDYYGTVEMKIEGLIEDIRFVE